MEEPLVLVVHSDRTSVAAVERVLREGGMRVIRAASAAEVAAQAVGQRPNVIVLDSRLWEASRLEVQQFASVASHDLKEPLRTITSYCQLLADRYRGRLDAQADEFLDHVITGVARMRRFLDDLLAYSRVGAAQPTPRSVELADVIGLAVANLHQAIEETGAIVEIGPLPTVEADPPMMLQLFQNLIANAVRFHGQEPPRVRIDGQTTQQGCRVSVADNGIGIDARHFDQIFGAFQRLHGPDEYPGTGMGLAICKEIVQHHGGRLWVESQPGQGSTFHVELPRGPLGAAGHEDPCRRWGESRSPKS